MPDLILEQPRKVTVVESIVEQIVRQIQAGRLKPGDKLPSERQLIEMLNVGRSSIREALQGLAAIGVVESRAGQGSFISQNVHLLMPDIENPALPASLQREMRLKLIEARCMVEVDIVGFAAQRATEEGTARLRELFDLYCEAIERRAFTQASKMNYDFHLALAQMAQNPFVAPMIDHLLRTVPFSLRESEFMLLADLTVSEIVASEVRVHRRIVEAVAAHDPEAAREAMMAHMRLEEDIVRRAFAGVTSASA
jgi:GntR family transcriptional regulator, transcriptional repressor for pyruvate dehydrogenase complex